MSDNTQESFKGKTGKKNEFKISNEYPYVMFYPLDYEFNPEDAFILSSSDNSYSEEVKYVEAEKQEGLLVIWFPMPPKGKKYNLKIKYHKQTDDNPIKEYLIFEEETLTLRDEETANKDQLLIRGKN